MEEYHEEISTETGVQRHDLEDLLQTAVREAFAKLDRVALGLSIGSTAGVLFFLATLVLVLKGGDVIGPRLGLLSQYFPGYRVSVSGSLLALAYGFVLGFVAGWAFAFLRNVLVFLSIVTIHYRAQRRLLRKLLEYI